MTAAIVECHTSAGTARAQLRRKEIIARVERSNTGRGQRRISIAVVFGLSADETAAALADALCGRTHTPITITAGGAQREWSRRR